MWVSSGVFFFFLRQDALQAFGIWVPEETSKMSIP